MEFEIYVRKRVPVKACVYTGDNLDTIQQFCPSAIYTPFDKCLTIQTFHGDKIVAVGDIITCDHNNEYNSYTKEVFDELFVKYTI